MRVSLSPVRKHVVGESAGPAPALLDPQGARVMLGRKADAPWLIEPIVPAADTLFGPRGVALAGADGPLIVSDTGHHRLLIWRTLPTHDGTPADLLIGQPDFTSEGRNGRASAGPATLNVPTGIATNGRVLAVADAWNHRVLIWTTFPTRSNQPADIVLGQTDFTSASANRGKDAPTAASLNWCYGVAIDGETLYVADTGNRRVLVWNRIPTQNGAPADLVLGQNDFATRDENGGRAVDAAGMRWPHAIAVDRGRLFVADAGDNRIMVWAAMPSDNGAPSTFVLGQADTSGTDHNQAAYYPTAAALNMPYGLARVGRQLIATDTANSRLVAYNLDAIATNAPARRLAGQASFQDKGDNRWGRETRDSLCWPYGIAAAGSLVAVADSGNNRVLLWEAAP
jgi:hypothetical protein